MARCTSSASLDGTVDVGTLGIRLIGLLWLCAAVGFVIAASRIWRGDPTALPLLLGLATLSALVCGAQVGTGGAPWAMSRRTRTG